MVRITRKRKRRQSYTVIVFDKDHIYEWPTNEYEHNQIMKIFKQDKPYEGIINNFTKWKRLFE